MSFGVENSGKKITRAMEKNVQQESASSSADFQAYPCLLGLEARLLCPEYGWTRKAVSITPWGLGTQHLVYSLPKRMEGWTIEAPFSLALGDVMAMSSGPRKFTMTNGALICEYTFHLRGAATVWVSGQHRRPSEGMPASQAQRGSEVLKWAIGSHSQQTLTNPLDTGGLPLLQNMNS